MEVALGRPFIWATMYEEAQSVDREDLIGYTAVGHTKKLILDTEVEFAWRGTVQVISVSHKMPTYRLFGRWLPPRFLEASNIASAAILHVVKDDICSPGFWLNIIGAVGYHLGCFRALGLGTLRK